MAEQDLLKIYNIVKKYQDGERNFTGINLNEANLSRVKLSSANLSDASLSVANLSSADLSGSNLSRANLNVARLSSANLTGAILNRATLNVANLVRADLTSASLVEALIIRSELIRAKLAKANFSRANLNGADLRESRMGQANFSRANLTGANLRGVFGVNVNLERADLRQACLVKADLPKADLNRAELRQANLTYANLSGADLSGANLRWADLRGANLSGADLSEANLSGANLSGANLSRANLLKASLVHTDLTQTNLIKADWMGADISGATLTGAKLYNVLRFNLKAEEITCEWVDLSANGDHSQIYKFDSESLNKFFNQALPTVRLTIDAPLTQDANLALATIYHKIAQDHSILRHPPSIEIDSRRTTLTFQVNRETCLFTIGFLSVFPFEDAAQTQKNLINLMRQIQDQTTTQKARTQVLGTMAEVVAKANEIKQIVRATLNLYHCKFFESPTQTVLRNSSQKELVIYRHNSFGRRLKGSYLPKSEDNSNRQSTNTTQPSLTQALSFIDSFDYLN
ncbi:MAG: pentapeptide repeat-containing protein [Microcoleaceae cyanobacterium]